MVYNNLSAVSNTICIDLLNISIDELQNLSFVNPLVNTFFSFLFHNHKTLHNDLFNEELPHLIYLEEDFIIGSRRHGDNYLNISLGGFEILPNTNLNTVDLNLYNVIESTLIQNNSLYLTPFLIDCYKSAFRNPVEKECLSLSFVNAQIEVSNTLFLTPEDIKKQFKVSTVFLDYKEKIDSILLKKIFYKNQIPILFVYMDENSTEFMGWNKDYLVALEKLKPINISTINNESALNTILDRINIVGFENLKNEELAFLDYYSKL